MTWRPVSQLVPGLVFISIGAASAFAAGGVVYVDGNALPGGDGRSWVTAYAHLQDALAAVRMKSSTGPVETRVAQGIYRPDRSEASLQGSGDRNAAFELTGGMTVSGGYAGIGTVDPNYRDPVLYPTVLSGDLAGNDAHAGNPGLLKDEPTRADNCHHVVTILGPATLEAVIITGGHASAVLAGDLELHPGLGGGLYVAASSVTLRDCVVRGNWAEYGGGLYAQGADVLLAGCTFDRNAAVRGGGIYCDNGRQTELANCLLTGNTGLESGAAIYSEGALVTLVNCTAAGNRAPAGRFLADDTPRPARGNQPPLLRVESCILANDGHEISNSYAALAIRYTDVIGGKAAVSDPQRAMIWGPGNIDADPCFTDPGYWDIGAVLHDPNDDFFVPGDCHLKSRAGRWDTGAGIWVSDEATSPCIDAGDPAAPFERELSPHGSRINMGAYGGTPEASKSDTTWWFMTTQGPLPAEGLGVVLPHEHIFTDLRGPTSPGYGQADPADVVRVMKPYLVDARQKGVGLLFECSGIGVGRNVSIIDRVARESRLPVVVPTGVYGRDNFAPPEHQNMGEDELTALFVDEIHKGIDATDIKAGFIKIATGDSALTPLEEKFLRAAGRAASETGAAVASHTPVSSNAVRQIAILESIDPAIRFIWVHAQNESNRDVHRQLAARGVYIEFDSLGWNPGQDTTFIAAIKDLLAAGYGDRILLSHDAGWYQPGQPNGGSQKPYTYLTDTFIPKLRNAGIDDATIRMITETNPLRAFGFTAEE